MCGLILPSDEDVTGFYVIVYNSEYLAHFWSVQISLTRSSSDNPLTSLKSSSSPQLCCSSREAGNAAFPSLWLNHTLTLLPTTCTHWTLLLARVKICYQLLSLELFELQNIFFFHHPITMLMKCSSLLAKCPNVHWHKCLSGKHRA